MKAGLLEKRDARSKMRPARWLVAIAALFTWLLGALALSRAEQRSVESIPCASINDVEAFERENGALTLLSQSIHAGGNFFREVYFYGDNRLFLYNSEPIGIGRRKVTLHIPSQGREITFEADMALVSPPDYWIHGPKKIGISAIVIYFLNTRNRRMNKLEFEVYHFDKKSSGEVRWLDAKLIKAAELDGVCNK